MGSIPGLGRSPGGGHGNPLQYSCLENPMDRGAWQASYSPWGFRDTTKVTFCYISSFPAVAIFLVYDEGERKNL